jgi:hypothetical protein
LDANRFDAIARVVGSSPDRRGLLKAATGGALGLVGLSALTDAASADVVAEDNKNCRNNNDCGKNQRCVKKGTADKKCKSNTKRCKCKKK